MLGDIIFLLLCQAARRSYDLGGLLLPLHEKNLLVEEERRVTESLPSHYCLRPSTHRQRKLNKR